MRHAVTIMKMAADLERSADLVVNICKVSRRIHGAVEAALLARAGRVSWALHPQRGCLLALLYDE